MALDLGIKETFDFIEHHLSLQGKRVLDVGAGRGDILEHLRFSGAAVYPIDKSAKSIAAAKELGRTVHEADICSLCFKEEFDAVLFSMSAHHIHPLSKALDVAKGALKVGGVLLVEDFAVDECDESSAKWYYESLGQDVAGDPMGQWKREHTDEHHPFNSGNEMLALIQERFHVRTVERVPFFYRYPASRAASETTRLFALEVEMIAAKRVQPLGLRVVASKTPIPA